MTSVFAAFRATGVFLLMVGSLAACTDSDPPLESSPASSPTSQSERLALDTAERVSARSAGLVTGRGIEGEVVDGKACFWVTNEAGEETSIVWPPGSIALTDPLRVESGQGEVLVEVGDRDSLIAGNPSDGPGCRAGSGSFLVNKVTPAS